MKTIVIYLDDKCRYVIKPTKAFEGSVKDLVTHLTGGNFKKFIVL